MNVTEQVVAEEGAQDKSQALTQAVREAEEVRWPGLVLVPMPYPQH